ncbi:hypothetical protein DFA_02916 [Cavenderia fasciculata]|uniref:Uncharacterized protein n=1 Tax=Cavenderia fasciculata TaxID=261658 RepID=F4PIU3_CACFS|nr:uncharacterized protein DFA_02916 [Cavenderia fasciculata]EGG24672.1 hypothetical protein DFA_02916 [Cavenderia fasciculata]|eukprot:XP_004362523.1 hypothetical protein DFA_02916 [Cavenderia fasciculata]
MNTSHFEDSFEFITQQSFLDPTQQPQQQQQSQLISQQSQIISQPQQQQQTFDTFFENQLSPSQIFSLPNNNDGDHQNPLSQSHEEEQVQLSKEEMEYLEYLELNITNYSNAYEHFLKQFKIAIDSLVGETLSHLDDDYQKAISSMKNGTDRIREKMQENNLQRQKIQLFKNEIRTLYQTIWDVTMNNNNIININNSNNNNNNNRNIN